MKCYKAHLKKQFVDKQNGLSSPITLTELELDKLINGDTITMTMVCGPDSNISFLLSYLDIQMITTCD